jgi:Putative Ig domain
MDGGREAEMQASRRCSALLLLCLVGVWGCECKITTDRLPDGAVNQPYSATLEKGTWCGDGIWALTSGTLPPGINLFSDGRLSGTPIAGGTFSFSVTFQEGNVLGGGGAVIDKSFALLIQS